MATAKTMPLLRRKQPQQTLMSPHLPFDLVVEILCRLPVKHLVQLRCVCKSWNSLISGDSKFAKKHLLSSTSCHDRHHLMRIVHDSHEFVICHSPISSLFSSASPAQLRYPLKEILNKKYYDVETSTCDGILCIKIESIDDSLVLLCNPSIRKLKILPPLKFTHQGYVLISYTLVYDRLTNNYKIIATTKIIASSKIEVYVHSLGTNYWRRIQGFPYPLVAHMLGIFVNDTVNWLACDSDCRRTKFIVSLDLEKESYQKFSVPVYDELTYFAPLGTLMDCLSILIYRRDNFSDIWIMREYGNEKSWTKLLSVRHVKECGVYGYTRALYISKDDQVLMEFLKKGKYSLVVYDSINNTFKIPTFQNNIHVEILAHDVYVESLVSPL